MELRVAGHEVLLNVHQSYCADDESAVIANVSKYKPLLDYLTKVVLDDVALSAITIRNVATISQRIASVTVDVEFVKMGPSRERSTETIILSEDPTAVFLPTVESGGKRFAVLVQQPKVATGGQNVAGAFVGTNPKPGVFSGVGEDLLRTVGIDAYGLKTLNQRDVVLGNEGTAPVKFLSSMKIVSEADLASIAEAADATGKIVLMDLEDVPSMCADLKACVAASLLL